MKDLRIGKLMVTKKAILLIAFCIFLNGMTIGAMAVNQSTSESGVNVLFIYIAIFLPYIFFFKSIRNNVAELD